MLHRLKWSQLTLEEKFEKNFQNVVTDSAPVCFQSVLLPDRRGFCFFICFLCCFFYPSQFVRLSEINCTRSPGSRILTGERSSSSHVAGSIMAASAHKQLTVLAFVPCHESLASGGEGGEGRSRRAAAEVVATGKTFVATGNPERTTNEEVIVYAELGAVKVLQRRADNHSHLAYRMFCESQPSPISM